MGKHLEVRPIAFCIAAALLAPFATAGLGRFGTVAVLKRLTRIKGWSNIEVFRISVEDGERMTRRAFRLMRQPDRCVPRAVVQYVVHSVSGMRVRLVIGVKRGAAATLDAHAWVEASARAVDDFAPLAWVGEDGIEQAS